MTPAIELVSFSLELRPAYELFVVARGDSKTGLVDGMLMLPFSFKSRFSLDNTGFFGD